jgi:REP element-mobilizing transposase RayT
MNDQEKLPERKPTRLRGYDYSNYGGYFITICTQGRKNILSHIVGDGALDVPQVALTKIGAIVEKYILSSRKTKGIVVENYVIMPNHVHMIIHITDAFKANGNLVADAGTSRAPSPTNAAIPHFISTLKRFCHIECGQKIFQRSYHDHIIRDTKSYDKIFDYIQNNPARWQEDCFYTAE